MGNHDWFTRVLADVLRPGDAALELGAGDGALALRLRGAGFAVDGLDRCPAPPGWFAWPATARWHRADLRAFAGWAAYPAVLGNLVLHHLADEELARLGETLDRHARLLVFNEPLRHARSRLLWTLLAPLGGAGPVTRHDGRISIEAGFRGDELPRALGLDPARWAWSVSETFLGACRVVAIRHP